MDWTQGYVNQIDYTHGYYGELSPALIEFACLSRGVSTRSSGKPVRYLELGFGQGSSLCVHAAACPGEFWGTDFLPAHACNAQSLAQASQRDVRIFDDSFEELLERGLPEFDVIVAHGIWSWISAENRKVIVDIARRKLAPGGVFYVSYNCLPGAARELPLRHLLKLHTDVASPSAAEIASKIDASLDFVQTLIDAGSSYFNEQPDLKKLVEQLRGKNHGYIAHEYLNRDWHPTPFADVARELTLAKLEFATSASLLHHLDGAGAPEKARKLLNETKQPIVRETIRDYLTNQRFRRDLFVKGLRPIAPALRAERLENTCFVLLAPPEHLRRKLTFPYGQAELNQEVHAALIAAFAQDSFAPKSLQFLRHSPLCKGIHPGMFLQAIRLLIGAGQLHPVQAEGASTQAAASSQALNLHVLQRSTLWKEELTPVLASPVTGSGIPVSHEHALFLHARSLGLNTSMEWAQHAVSRQAALGLQLIRDGEPISDPQENLAQLQRDADEFAKTSLPLLQALRVA